MTKNLKIMQSFTIKNLPNLDTCVLGALELFQKNKLPNLNIKFKRPLVVGSGNAEATGKIIFEDKNAIFASESNYQSKLKFVDGVILISASGGKHAPIIAKAAKNKKVILLTNNPYAEAKQFADKTYLFPKQREPYTYNTSTYLGMILAKTKENPKSIQNFLKKLKKNIPKSNKYFIVVPSKFSGITRMINVKFIELFGRQVARDVETLEYMKHATTVVPSNEIFIYFGEKGNYGKNKLLIPLPKNADYGAMMATAYFIVGKIQAQHLPYFKKNIENFMKKVSKIFNKTMSVIVE